MNDTCDTETAKRRLEEINLNFRQLVDAEFNPQTLYACISELIYRLSAAISYAESSGINKKDIIEIIIDARMVFALSPYIKRIQEWPRGYQGDYETVEVIHKGVSNNQLSSIAECMEYYAQTLPITQQHRNKLIFQQELASKHIRENRNILSVGCGGAIDISNALMSYPNYSGTLSFIDMDEDALSLTRERTQGYKCTYNNINIIRGIGSEPNEHYSLILCGGLFDYLNDRIAGSLIKQIVKKMCGGGQLFMSNIATDNPFRIPMGYFGSWELIERSESEIEELFQNNNLHEMTVECQREATGLAILAIATLN